MVLSDYILKFKKWDYDTRRKAISL
jgi:hypothetical protein